RGCRGGAVARAQSVRDRLRDLSSRRGLLEMERHLRDVLVDVRSVELLEGLSHVPVERDAPGRRQLRVEHVSEQRVYERIASACGCDLRQETFPTALAPQLEQALPL